MTFILVSLVFVNEGVTEPLTYDIISRAGKILLTLIFDPKLYSKIKITRVSYVSRNLLEFLEICRFSVVVRNTIHISY